MVSEVIFHESGDEVVGVVVACLEPQSQRVIAALASSSKVLREELMLDVEVIGVSLVNEDVEGRAIILLDELCGIVGVPGCLVLSEVSSEGFLAPRAVDGVGDG